MSEKHGRSIPIDENLELGMTKVRVNTLKRGDRM